MTPEAQALQRSSPITRESACAEKRALIVSLPYTSIEMPECIGREAYSYHYVYRSFAPLFARWGRTSLITHAESRLDYAVAGHDPQPLHVSLLPLHMTYFASQAANIAFPSWEFPDIPNTNLGGLPRNNWARIANNLSLIVTHSEMARKAFLRAGVKTPLHLLPIPVPAEYFDLPRWRAGQSVTLDCPCYGFPERRVNGGSLPPPEPIEPIRGFNLRKRARRLYRHHVKPHLPAAVDKGLWLASRLTRLTARPTEDEIRLPYPKYPILDLSGVVYTTILNPFDPRKNWQDLLTAYLIALADCEDATLVIKLLVRPELLSRGVGDVVGFYQGLGLRHQCRLVLVTAYLSDEQMLDLARASTYYVNSSRAEGSCLPLQNFLAAGRPAIAPRHSGMADYFDDHAGFVIESHPEPTCFPHDPKKRLTTTWHRLVWSSLRSQFQTSYEVARRDQEHYQALASRARESIADFASLEAVWPLLARALDAAAEVASANALADARG
jgi:glycosyltransferase involved in cell wall biosynthesis